MIPAFHYILPLKNLRSVLTHGILSPEKAQHYNQTGPSLLDVAARSEKRADITIPGGLRLTRYANLYIHARNRHLYRHKDRADQLCILAVSKRVLEIDGAVVTDQPAESDFVRFYPPSQIDQLDFESILAENRDHPADPIATWRHAAQTCAEVLIPHVVPPDYIEGGIVVSDSIGTMLARHLPDFELNVDPTLFFG